MTLDNITTKYLDMMSSVLENGTTGIHHSTLRALVSRGLLEPDHTIGKNAKNIINFALLLTHYDREWIALRSADEPLGMFCSIQKGYVVDCYGNPYVMRPHMLYKVDTNSGWCTL